MPRSGYGSTYTYIRNIRGLRDIRKIAQSLRNMGYELDIKSLTMDFPGYEDVSVAAAAQLGLREKPIAYKIRGKGIEIKIENFCRVFHPGMIGGQSEYGVRGYIELTRADREAFERIERAIEDYLTVKEGYEGSVFDIEREKRANPFLVDFIKLVQKR